MSQNFNKDNLIINEYSFIKGIEFTTYSPEQIKKTSVVNITKSQLYDSNGEPTINGLFDPKMGYTEPRKRCKTCYKTLAECPGHFGHIELAKPVFNIQAESEIAKILKCVCIKCSKLLIDKNHPWIENLVKTTKNKRKDRFEKIHKFIIQKKIKFCGNPENKNDLFINPCGCGANQPIKYINNIKKDSNIVVEWKDESIESSDTNERGVISQAINAELLLSIFKRISEEDANVLGFSKEWCHPSSLIITVLPVVPPCVRPSVRQYNSQRSEDDLTHKYNDIIKTNETLKKKLITDNDKEHIKNYTDLLQYHVSTLFNNDIKGINPANTRSGRPMKTIAERLKGKQGRIRHNLMGKRVDFSARSVISPDANINIGELGVPLKVAMNLTFPETVNKYNINKLYKLVRNGNNKYPGSKSIKSVKDKKTRLLEYQDTSRIVLEFGDIVNRHLLNGDTVLFNRQPSLHKMSMMAHKVRVIHEGNTFRLNVDVCKPYNADFDGDEMNMHVPQSYQTAIELEIKAAVPKHIMSPSNMSPIIKPSQDNLLGLFKMTDNDVKFTHQELMNMLIGVEKFTGKLPEPSIKEGQYIRWTGKQIFSMILPQISLYKEYDTQSKLENVLIENGILKTGQVNGGISSNIVHIIHNDYGYKEAARYLNDLQKIVTRYMIRSGYSVGISDLIVHHDIKKRYQDKILDAKKKVIELTKKTHLNILEDINEGLDQIYEAKVRGVASDVTKEISKIGNNILSKKNRINYMVQSGSKGKTLNIQQMMYLLGEQSIDGKRVPLGFIDRTLPHYPKYENGLESRGFVASNFIDGLTPQELFFHAMAGREGLIDTAVKTATSGYLQRKLIKATEDLKANHDYTVRSSNNDIVEFIYGSDGFYPSHLEKQKSRFINLNNENYKKNYIIDENEKFDTYMLKKNITAMKKQTNYNEIISSYNDNVNRCIELIYDKYSIHYKSISDIVLYYPVNIKKKIDFVKKMFNVNQNNKTDITPIYVIESINVILEYCSVNKNINNTLSILLHDYLSPKRILRDLRFTRMAFDYLVNLIMLKFEDLLVEGGEMVGPLASQSIGEKSTQLTLNTFHLAGVGEKSNVTRGVPRLHELISNTKNPKQPMCVIYLDKKHRSDIDLATKIGNNLKSTRIGDLILTDAIYIDNNNKLDNVLEEDKEIMKIYQMFSELDPNKSEIKDNCWLIKLEFDKKKIIESKVSMSDIHIILKNKYPNSVLMYHDDNASKLIFRLKLQFESNPNNGDDDIIYLKEKIEEIKDILLKGIVGIDKIYYLTQNNKYYEKIGNLYEEHDEIVLNTDGSNLFDILISEGVDTKRTYSIDPNEINCIFGIEAARFMIEEQIKEVLQGSDAMTSPRHLSLLCNKMTRGGDIMSVDRHGINKENIGPLAKSSFEETTDQLYLASIFGDKDDISGVSANIMVGQIPACGTGDSQILLDDEMLMNQETYDEEEEIDFNTYFESSKYCEENDEIKFNINAIPEENIEIDDLPEIVVE